MVNVTKQALENYPDDRITVCVNRKSLTNKFVSMKIYDLNLLEMKVRREE